MSSRVVVDATPKECPDGGSDAGAAAWFVASGCSAGGLSNALPPMRLATERIGRPLGFPVAVWLERGEQRSLIRSAHGDVHLAVGGSPCS
jgi:hypothetical protein